MVFITVIISFLQQAAGSQGRRRLHDDLLSSLCKCHTSLFDVEPTGRLLNRFNSDMAMIDKKLATTFQRLVQFVLMCLSAIVVNVIITPWSLIIASIIIAVFYVLQRIFRTSARCDLFILFLSLFSLIKRVRIAESCNVWRVSLRHQWCRT